MNIRLGKQNALGFLHAGLEWGWHSPREALVQGRERPELRLVHFGAFYVDVFLLRKFSSRVLLVHVHVYLSIRDDYTEGQTAGFCRQLYYRCGQVFLRTVM